MSHFTVIQTQIIDDEALLAGLSDLGFKQLERHEIATPLYGVLGDIRPQTVEVVIRRQFIGAGSNDIGFKRQENGSYNAIISAYDRQRFNGEWLNKLSQRYAYHLTKSQLAEQNFTLISEESQADGRIHLLVRRVV